MCMFGISAQSNLTEKRNNMCSHLVRHIQFPLHTCKNSYHRMRINLENYQFIRQDVYVSLTMSYKPTSFIGKK